MYLWVSKVRESISRDRNINIFLVANAISLIGSAAAPIALSFALFSEGKGIAVVSAVMAFEALSMSLIILFGGSYSDRISPRTIMIFSDLSRAVIQAALAISLLCHVYTEWIVYLLVALLGAGNALYLPCRNRFLTQIVADDALSHANSRLIIGSSLAGLIGPSIGGGLLVYAGGGWAVALDALTYFVSAILIMQITIVKNSTTGGRDQSLIQSLSDGWVEFKSRPWLWRMVLLLAVMHVISWAPTEVLGAQAYAKVRNGSVQWGMILSCLGVGAIIGGGIASRLRPRLPLRATLLWLLLYPLLPLSLAAGFSWWIQAICAFLGGIEMAIVTVLWDTTLQRTIPEQKLSRVSAYDVLGSFCLMPLGYVLAAPMAHLAGMGGALSFGALTVVCAIALAYLRDDIRLVRYDAVTLTEGDARTVAE
jgi:MFS family permease